MVRESSVSEVSIIEAVPVMEEAPSVEVSITYEVHGLRTFNNRSFGNASNSRETNNENYLK
jgi:hypothetical protein